MAIDYSGMKKRLEGLKYSDPTVTVVEDEKGKKVSTKPSSILEDIAPTRATTTPKTITINKKKKDKWFESGAFKDGYDFGDITKTILGTTTDISQGFTKGALNIAEQTVDLGSYLVSGGLSLVGADKQAEAVKKFGQKNLVEDWDLVNKTLIGTNPALSLLNTGKTVYDAVESKNPKDLIGVAPLLTGKTKLSDTLDNLSSDSSLLGNKSDEIVQGVGYVGGMAGLSMLGINPMATAFVTSMGSEMTNAFDKNASYGDAFVSGLISGGAEAGSEMLFGGLGKAIGKGALDDLVASGVGKLFKNQLAKNMAEFGIKATGEGLEEIISSAGQEFGRSLTYGSEYGNPMEFLTDKERMKEFLNGVIISAITQTPGAIRTTKANRDYISGYTQNEQKVLDTLTSERTNELAKQKTVDSEIAKAITTKETEQGGTLSAKEKSALTEQIKAKIDNGEIDISSTKIDNKDISKIRQEVEESMNKGLLDTSKIDSILGNTITEKDGILAKSYIETAKRSENFKYDTEKVTDTKEKAVYDSASKYFNDTTRSHEFVDKVAKISKEKGTNYGFINNEELKSLGHDVEGKQVNGLVRTNQNGEQTVLINVDSPKALNTIVGHETTHLLEGTREYTELQEAIFNYAKEKGDFNSRQKSLNELYEGIDNANVDSELTADLVGDYLFTDSKFIDSLSNQKPTVFQRIKDLIDDLVVKFAGTKEEKALREVQKKFREAYKKNNVAENVEGNKYSINEEVYNKVKNEKQLIHTTNNLMQILDSGVLKGDTLSAQYQNKGSKIAGYGQQGIKFKPDILNYVDKMFKGDGATRRDFLKENANTFNTLEELLEDNPKIYDELTFKGEIPLSVIEEVSIPKNSSQELINKLTDAGIKISYYNPAPSYNTTKDVQYSLSEKGTLQDSNGNDVKLETSDTGTHGTLMAVHNLSESKLKGILELGGFPVPSIAIMNPSTTNLEYGDISVLFDKSTIDPSNKANEVYGSDVYSPRFPQTVQKINEKELSKLENYLGKNLYLEDTTLDETVQKNRYTKEFIDKFAKENNITADNVYKDSGFNYTFSTDENVKNFVTENNVTFEKLLNDEQLRNKFYELYRQSTPETLKGFTERKIETFEKAFDDNNVNIGSRLDSDFNSIKNGSEKVLDEYATEKALRDKVLNQYEEQYAKFLTEKLTPVFEDKYIRNSKELFTPSGNRRSFNQLYNEYTLDNVVKEMKGKVRGEEGFFYGAGNIRSQVTPQFKSIADIKANEGKLITNSEMETVKQDIDSELNNLSVTAKNFGGYTYDSYETALNEIAGLKKITSDKAKSILNEYGFKNVPDILVDKSIEFLEKLKNAPTEYFEAKPQRAVGLDEVQAIVVPNRINNELKQQLLDKGLNVVEYDPNIEGDKQSKINQFDDLKFSLSQQGEQIAPTGNYNVYGEDVKYQEAISPLQEEIQNITETLNEIKEQIAPVQEATQEVEYTQPTKAELDNLESLRNSNGTEYAREFFNLRDKYGQAELYKGLNQYKKAPDTYEAPVKQTNNEFTPVTETDLPMVEQQNREAFNTLDDSNIPAEVEQSTPDNNTIEDTSLFETRDYVEVGSRKVNAYQYDHPEVKPYFQQEALSMLSDLKNSVKGERLYNDDLYYSSGGEQGYFGTQRQTTDDIAELLDGMNGKYKYTYADIEKGLNAIIKDDGAENNAISKRIEFYLDQRLRNGYTDTTGYKIPANQDYIDTMKAIEINDYYNNIPIDDSMIPVENAQNVSNSDNLAPLKVQNAQKTGNIVQSEAIRPQPDKDTHGYTLKRVTPDATNEEIAKVLDTEPKTESQRNKRKWAILKANVFDKGAVFEDVSLKNKNRELMGKWDYTLTSEARGQNVIGQGHYEYDPISKSTKQVSKSLNDIRVEVENTGLTKEFYEYMYHKHNYDRMLLQERYGEENKPVFGYNVSALDSQIKVLEYESKHPEFTDYAQDVYDYLSADRQQLVKEGVISQETADLWEDMYPHYVPIRRVDSKGLNIDVPLDTGRTSVNAPIKKATGGNTDILPLFDTMAQRTLQTYRATAKNSFGVELMNTLGTKIDKQATNIDDVIDNIDNQEGLLQEGKNGSKPTFTVFENGEKVTFEITEDMYDALKPLSDSSLLSKTFLPLNKVSNFHRGLLTEYNPVFMLTNAIKDSQDVLINSQHSAKTYAKVPEAFTQLLKKGYWYQEYIANGGEQNSYFDSQENTFKTENKGLSKILDIPPLSTISKLNNYIEMTPRLAEYIASREAGRSVEVSMLDASRVTTNFKAGGNLTKWANRNGATFLNASVQGAMQQVRNVREAKANGLKGWVNLATKFAIAGLPAYLLNALLWEDDEEYEELSDYVKQNYYIISKDDNGNFIRIPKGRTLAVIQEGIQQMSNAITGDDEVDLKSFIELAISNLAPNNPIENNIFSPITQVATNKTWYGGDLVPTRLQDLPASEQYDESTDLFSKWIGEVLNVSPYKVNYVLDQYSGGVGDIVLPMITPEAKSDADTLGEQLIAPLRSKFTTNAIMNNQNVGDLYETSEKLTTEAKKSNATDTDVLSNKYMNSIKAEMNELYKQKREIQNSNLSNSEKYNQVKDIQAQINEIANKGLNNYESVNISGNYATVGDKEYKIGSDGEWQKITDKQLEKQNEVTDYLDIAPSEYWKNKEEYDYAYENPGKYQTAVAITDYDTYVTYKDKINDITADKDESGKSINGSRKEKIISYVNSLDLSIPQKAMLIKQNYSSFDDYNNEIVEYVSNLDVGYQDKINILKSLDMEVDSDGNVRW